MHRVALALGILIPASASANDSKIERVLKQLDPDARFEQICDLEAMQRIGKDKAYKPERTIVSALEIPKVSDSTMTGSGGAFRTHAFRTTRRGSKRKARVETILTSRMRG